MTPTLESRVAKALELGEAATPGPWRVATQNGCRVWVDDGRIIIADAGRSLELRQLHKKANAALIAASHDHLALIRDLAAEVERLGKLLAGPKYTEGHCDNKKMKGGCPMHNLQCGYPQCDRRPV
jgi:hypothetical protein